MIHISKLQDIMAAHKGFSITFIASDGRKICVHEAVLTSTGSETFNIKILTSGEFRTIRKFSIIEINGEEVCI